MGFKLRMLLATLPKDGANAQPALPKIKAINAGKFQRKWKSMIKQIESATESPKILTFKEAINAGKNSENK